MRLKWILLFVAIPLSGTASASDRDSLQDNGNYVHMIRLEAVPGNVLHTNDYLNGNNPEGRTMNHAFSAKLKYAFMRPQHTAETQIYKGAYQGLGVAYHDFNPQLSNPVSVFIFQGARIATLTRQLSLNYEWNLGLTCGWNPYDPERNPDNKVIGSRVTAYIDADFYFNWRLSREADVNLGVSLTHYSNGNTKIPNAGLNVAGARVGVAYYLNRERKEPCYANPIPPFERHVSYDLVLYGAWKRMGFYSDDGPWAVPGSFAVAGFNFSPMYNINHWLNAGASLDGIFDHSANIHYNEYADEVTYPETKRQMALGLSGRAEFVMPYFTINIGMGHHFINAKGHLNGWYEILALKLDLTRHTFLHIGYSLNDFKNPNNLMLGAGVRFHSKRKSL